MAQRGGGGADDSSESWVIILIIFGILLFLLINYFFWVFATGWKWVRIAEVGLLSFIVPDFIQNWMRDDFNSGLRFLLDADPKAISANVIGTFDNIYVRYFNLIPGGLLIYYGFKVFRNTDSVSVIHNMESMILKMSNAFPHNKNFIGIHPEEMPIDFYPDDPGTYEFSMAMTERQFSLISPPLGLTAQAKRRPELRKPIWDGKKGFNEDLARRSFDVQVGPLYRGYNYLNKDEKRLFDLFRENLLVKQAKAIPIIQNYAEQALRKRRPEKVFSLPKNKRKGAAAKLPALRLEYLQDIPSHRALGKRVTEYVDENLIKEGSNWIPKESEIRSLARNKNFNSLLKHVLADEIMANHAFTYTGLMSLLEAAREGRTLAPSSLRWLKGRNRTLWYALNCVGKKVAFVESSGTFAHWLLECEAKIPIPHAEVTEAIEALKVGLGLKAKHGDESGIEGWD